MQKSIFALVLAAFMVSPGFAAASKSSDRAEAIRLCRAEVAAQAGLSVEEVRFDTARVSARQVRVDLDVWREGRLNNIRCDVTRGATLTVAAIDPALGAAPSDVAAAH